MARGLAPSVQIGSPAESDVLAPVAVEALVRGLGGPPTSLVGLGDTMLDGRTRRVIARRGTSYPFESVAPLLAGVPIVLANHESPFASQALAHERRFAYRVSPSLTSVLLAGGISVVTLANNHLYDCGAEGVMESIEAVDEAGLSRIGVGRNTAEAHTPLIRQAGVWRVGLLGYYWNRRCAATARRPGCAMGTPDTLRADIGRLRPQVDWVVATFHWGNTYEREPQAADRDLAHAAIDSGADLVLGHHPHVLQPYEVYRARPIFYSLGNFAFGSGNSHAEGLLVRVSFTADAIRCWLVPLYVKNRDPRVNYQPRVLGGSAAERVLVRLGEMSAPTGPPLHLRGGVGLIDVPLPAHVAPP